MTPPFAQILKRDGQPAEYDRERIVLALYKATAAVGDHDRELANRLAAQTERALFATYAPGDPPTVEDIQDVVERVLIQEGHPALAKAYILYRNERSALREEKSRSRRDNIPYKAMWHMLDWALKHDCESVSKLNAHVTSGRLPWLIERADEHYEGILDDAASTILERRDNLRFIIVAGPSSSGKTTTTHKIAERLEQHGLHVIPLSLDNYFFDLEKHPKDEFGDYDFETPEAMDLALINEHLAELDAGRGIDMPVYDFKQGRRIEETKRFEPAPNTLVLLDTLHGLYDGLTSAVPDAHKFRVYIETVGQLKGDDGRWLRWTDTRLLRRMIRDSQHRGYSPEKTILHWHYVRRSELKHIIPHHSNADFVVNSALAYELLFLKKHLGHHLPPFLEKYQGDERRLDGIIRAERVQAVFDSLATVDDAAENAVPPSSLLREFIGGSAYDVH